jgi:hypothetical protein
MKPAIEMIRAEVSGSAERLTEAIDHVIASHTADEKEWRMDALLDALRVLRGERLVLRQIADGSMYGDEPKAEVQP